MARKGNSIAAVASRALGIEQKFLPECLRNRLNYYVKDNSLKKQLLDESDKDSESIKYTSRPVRAGNKTYIRNLVILDTLFEDKKIVTKWLNGEAISKEKLEQYLAEWRAKKNTLSGFRNKITRIK
jgi:hypothetical protein